MKYSNDNWTGFKGDVWRDEINVRDFIQLSCHAQLRSRAKNGDPQRQKLRADIENVN